MIDQDVCIGCHACTVACKTEHEVPLGVYRTWVKYVEKGAWPDTKRFFSVLRCNHCTDAPCVAICPTSALYKRDDGIVDFDTSRCIGCKSCMQACPYDALYIDPRDHTAQKCNYCAHRVDVGLEPACVVICPEQAIVAGDLDDPDSRIAHIVATETVTVRSPEQGTGPNVYYKGVESANLDPVRTGGLADGGIWRDPPGMERTWLAVDLTVGGGDGARPAPTPTIEAPAGGPPRVVYDTDHPMPWGWKVSSYFLTKGIAAGVAITIAAGLGAGGSATSAWTAWIAPLLAGIFLALTGGLLVWDLKRPDRFWYLLTKGNGSSWLVKGAWILTAYGGLLGVWFLAGIVGAEAVVRAVVPLAAVLGVAVAGYTAFLFGQAEGRDLWQSPSLLWHMIAGAFVLGGGASLLAVAAGASGPAGVYAWTMIVGAVVLGLLALGEIAARHPTVHVAAAVHHMTRGRYAAQWWSGLVLSVVAPAAAGLLVATGGPVFLGAVGGLAAAAGIWLVDDAFVRAGQSVPLS